MDKEDMLPVDDDNGVVDASGGPMIGEIDEPALDELLDEEEDDIDAINSSQYYDDVSDDSVRLYLREIGKIPLLNAEEELLLARRIKLGSLLEAEGDEDDDLGVDLDDVAEETDDEQQ